MKGWGASGAHAWGSSPRKHGWGELSEFTLRGLFLDLVISGRAALVSVVEEGESRDMRRWRLWGHQPRTLLEKEEAVGTLT